MRRDDHPSHVRDERGGHCPHVHCKDSEAPGQHGKLWEELITAASRHKQRHLIILFDDNVHWVDSFIAGFRPNPPRRRYCLVRLVHGRQDKGWI